MPENEQEPESEAKPEEQKKWELSQVEYNALQDRLTALEKEKTTPAPTNPPAEEESESAEEHNGTPAPATPPAEAPTLIISKAPEKPAEKKEKPDAPPKPKKKGRTRKLTLKRRRF